jgi:hypothetical protein
MWRGMAPRVLRPRTATPCGSMPHARRRRIARSCCRGASPTLAAGWPRSNSESDPSQTPSQTPAAVRCSRGQGGVAVLHQELHCLVQAQQRAGVDQRQPVLELLRGPAGRWRVGARHAPRRPRRACGPLPQGNFRQMIQLTSDRSRTVCMASIPATGRVPAAPRGAGSLTGAHPLNLSVLQPLSVQRAGSRRAAGPASGAPRSRVSCGAWGTLDAGELMHAPILPRNPGAWGC